MNSKSLTDQIEITRRHLLRRGLVVTGIIALGHGMFNNPLQTAIAQTIAPGRKSNIPNLANTLHEVAVENDPATRMVIPRGFSVRELARTGRPS